MRILKTVPSKVLDVAFSPDCRAVAAAVEGPCIFLWNLNSPTFAPVRLEAEGSYCGKLRFSPGGRRLSWQTGNGCRTHDRDTRTTTTEEIEQFRTAFWWRTSDDGARAMSAHSIPDHYLAGWRLAEGDWVRQWQISTRELSAAALTLAPTGDRFAMLTRSTVDARWWQQPMRLEVRDAATSDLLTTGSYPYSYTGRLAFQPQGEQIACIHEMTLLAWPLPGGGDSRRVRNEHSRKHFTALAYHPNGRLLFVTSNDETVHAFDTTSLERVNRYTWQIDRLSAVAVSPDGTLAAAGSANGDVVVWDLD